MADRPREPQSYGSERDWVTGKTGGKIHDPKATPPPEHSDFYDDKRESETTAPDQGGKVSDFQLAENQMPEGKARGVAGEPVTKVTSRAGGAKRDSFFKKRDYE